MKRIDESDWNLMRELYRSREIAPLNEFIELVKMEDIKGFEIDNRDKLTEYRAKLPELPGIYKYRDKDGLIIYIGKAINLKKRVNSYFNRPILSLDLKTRMLVKKIASIETVITNTEMEALLLENNLIKQHQPKFNIALRDGKSYPYICVTNERFPRVFITRNRIHDGSTYYGPYPTQGAMFALMDFITSNYKLRTCNYALTDANIKAGKFRACLDHQIGKCKAPCIGKQTEDEYNEDIRQIRELLKGKFKVIIDQLKDKMTLASDALQFEEAYYLKNKIDQILKYKTRNTIVSDSITDVEVVTIRSRNNLSVVNHFKILNGTIVKTHSFDIWQKNGDTEPEILQAVISHLVTGDPEFGQKVYTNIELFFDAQKQEENSKLIIPESDSDSQLSDYSRESNVLIKPNEHPNEEFSETNSSEIKNDKIYNENVYLQDYSEILSTIKIKIPTKGDILKVIQLSIKNCEAVLDEKSDTSRVAKKVQKQNFILDTAQKDLRLTKKPLHIECFDNSNMQGYAPVSSCVVFRNGLPSKKEYRVFNVKTVDGIDDFATMYEVVHRRYKRYLDENMELPDLVVIDGGKGQLSSAIRALTDLGIVNQLPIISIAKRLEEIYYKDDPVPLYIDKKSTTLKLIQQLRNEAHDTAINGHRSRRDQKTIKTELTEIKGIGIATAKKLLSDLGSVKKIKEAPLLLLEQSLGPAKALIVYDYFHSIKK